MVSEEPLGMDTQESFMSNDNRTRRPVPKQGVQRQSKFAVFHCYNCHEKRHIANECRHSHVPLCPEGKPGCKTYGSRNSSNSESPSKSGSSTREEEMIINEGEEFTFTAEELMFSATEKQDQDWLQSISRILDTACT